MAYRSPMPTRILAGIAGRLATALSAGIGLGRAWKGEQARVPRAWRGAVGEVGRALEEGESFSAALARAGETFPPLFRGMVEVGERTGHEPEALRELAGVLDHAVRTRRNLLSALVGPAIQSIVAILVVAFLVWVGGALRDASGGPLDILGFGLVGVRGVVALAVLLGILAAAATLAGRAAAASWRRHGVVRPLVDRIPLVGTAARASEAAAWCRAASLAAGAGLDAGRLARLASNVAPGLSLDPDDVERRLRGGATLADVLRHTRRFPADLVEAVAVGELTGNTAETLDRLAVRYDEDARRALEAAARAAAGLVWAAVAGLIIFVIFRIFSFYVGAIQSALGGR